MSELDDIRARRAAITPGAWQLVEMGRDFAVFAPHPVESGNTCIAVVDGGLTADSKRDGEFIAAAPADIDTLLAMVDALTSVWAQIVTIAEESTDSSTYISAYNMSRVRDVVRDWKEATVRR